MFHPKFKTIRQKLMFAIIISIIVTLIFSSIAYYFIMEVNNRQLYTQISTNISLSSESLNQNFDTIKQFSNLIVVDREIQNLLAQQKDVQDYTAYKEAVNGLNNIINIYHDHLQKYNVNYILLEGIGVTANTYIPTTETLPSHIKDDLLQTAAQNFGQFKIVTDYSKDYGLFIVHSIRRIENAKLDYLGTLIININLDDLIQRIFPNEINYSNIQFVILDTAHLPIYYSDHSDVLADYVKQEQLESNYKIKEVNEQTYLQVGHKIFANWTIFSFLPYNDIRKTSVSLRNMLLLIIFLIGLLSIFTTDYAIKIKISKPIHDLVNEMEKFGTFTHTPNSLLEKYRMHKDEIGYLYRKFDEMTLNIEHLIEVNYKNELLYKETQLQYLRSQINPHFLYNTLDSINWRAKKAGDTIITEMVESLACLLRGSLSDKKHFTLNDEIQLIQNYLNIQKIRYGDSLSYFINCSPHLLELDFPSMVLQPIVENAIRYSLEYNGEDCTIYIAATCTDKLLAVDIQNTGSQFEENHFEQLEANTIESKGFGIGLLNIHKRIQLKYGANFGLYIYNQDGLASVSIRIPETRRRINNVKNDDC